MEKKIDWTQGLTLIKSVAAQVPSEVMAPIERLSRELLYLQKLLILEGRGTEWPAIEYQSLEVWNRLRGGAWDKAAARVADVEHDLQELSTLAKSLTITYVGHAHMDMNWLWGWPETVAMVVNTLTTVNNLLQEFPDFYFSQSQTAIYDIVRRFDPMLFDNIGDWIRQGRWEITANQWVEGDKNLASDESVIRHILYSKKFFAEHWNIAPDAVAIDFEPDTFGHPRGLPTIYQDAGIRWLYFCRGGPGHTTFRWQAPDGSEILAWSDFQEWYNGTITGDEVQAALRFYEETGIRHFLKVYGVGDHGGGPTRSDLTRLMAMRAWPLFPTVCPGRLADHFTALETVRSQLPIVTGELNYVFPGCYTAQSSIKTMNATLEAALRTAEGLQSMAWFLRVSVPRNATPLRVAWQTTLFNQFHDILSGSGIPDTYRYALGAGQDAAAASVMASQQAMDAIAREIHTEELADCGLCIVVFNPLAWTRTDTVEVDVYERFEPGTPLQLVDANGDSQPVQYHYDTYWNFPGHRRVRLTFVATVPGLGYAVYGLKAGIATDVGVMPDIVVATRAQGHQVLRISGHHIALLGLVSHPEEWPNEALPRGIRLFRQFGVSTYQQGFVVQTPWYRMECKGGESGITIERVGENTVTSGVGSLEWVLEEPHGMSAWEIGADQERHELTGTRWRLEEVGPVRIVLRGESHVGASTIGVSVQCYADGPHIDWLVDLDWREIGTPDKGVPGIVMHFPVPGFSGTQEALFGQSNGFIRRPIPSRDVPAQGWTAIVETGRSTIVYHPTRYGVGVEENDITVTLIRASYEPDPYADVGQHRMPLSYRWEDDVVNPDGWTRHAIGHLSRLQGWVTELHRGRLPMTKSSLALSSTYGVVTAVKPAENSSGIIVRVRHDSEDNESMVFKTAGSDFEITPVSIMEIPQGDALSPIAGMTTMQLAPHSLMSLLWKNKG